MTKSFFNLFVQKFSKLYSCELLRVSYRQIQFLENSLMIISHLMHLKNQPFDVKLFVDDFSSDLNFVAHGLKVMTGFLP